MAQARKNSSQHVSLGRLQLRKELLVLSVLLVVLVGAIALMSRAATTSYTYNKSTGAHSGRMFTPDSPLNQPIPADVKYLSDGQVRIQKAGMPAIISLLEWSVPVFDVDSTTPKATIYCYVYQCDDISKSPVPVPQGVFAQRGGDGHVTIIDNSTRKIYDYWIWRDCSLTLNLIGAQWCPGSAGVANMDGNGVGGGTNVAGLAGGIVRTYEIEQGVIDHALLFSVPTTCQGTPFYPALYSDGKNTDKATCLPIGARIQLDPSINVDAIPGITQMEKIMAKALQKYGAYNSDTGGVFGFGVEFDRTGRNIYQKAGAPATDYFALKSIPWEKVKIVDPQWKTDGTKAYAWGGTATAPTTVSATIAPTPTITSTPSSPPPAPTLTTTPTPSPVVTPSPATGDATPPSQPSNMRPTLLFDWLRGKYFIDVAWQKSTDNVAVKDYLFTRNTTLVGPQTTTSYQDYNVTANTIYSYEVRARDTAGNLSNPTKITTIGRCFLFYCWLE